MIINSVNILPLLRSKSCYFCLVVKLLIRVFFSSFSISMLIYLMLVLRHWALWWQVKLAKCIVHNVVVDISFNQLGGLIMLIHFSQEIFIFIFYSHSNNLSQFCSFILCRNCICKIMIFRLENILMILNFNNDSGNSIANPSK